MTPLELLSPARDADTAFAAIMAGADAVYMGGPGFGARRAASNSIEDIRRVIEAAHPFNVKVYVTVNTIIYDNEIDAAQRMICELYNIGVDALIIQDLGILRMDIPPIELHASTQCDIRTPAKARWLADLGMTRLVVARELSFDEIAAISREVPDVEIEAFVHGALCVSYSGDCRASYVSGGRSANRGECAQICRLPYTIRDASGREVAPEAHYLSLRDLCRISQLDEMASAGVTSFKIEGRLKDAAYVRNVVAAYSARLDRLVAESGGRYGRQSWGRSHAGFTPDLAKSFNRGFTTYFSHAVTTDKMASLRSPKAIGREVGTVISSRGRTIEARLTENLANGDGLGYFDKSGKFCGFRLNRVDGSRLYAASDVSPLPGTPLYRNRDKDHDDAIEGARSRRLIAVDLTLAATPDSRLALTISDSYGHSATAVSETVELTEAVTPQRAPRKKILTKLGATRYEAAKVVDLVGETFVTPSLLAALRRKAVETFERTLRAIYHRGTRRPELASARPDHDVVTFRDNVANRLARKLYEEHGATIESEALEVTDSQASVDGEVLVMNTRYCLRRELGCCLKTPEGSRMPRRLWLANPRLRLRVDFDCANCQMRLYSTPGR